MSRSLRPRLLAATVLAVVAAGLPQLPAVAAASSGTVTIGGQCLDDVNAGTTAGNPVQLAACDGSAEQNFTWNADGTVGVLGNCLAVAGGSVANGALLQLAGCASSAPEQHFAFQPDTTILSAQSGKCLQVQGSSVVAGDGVGLAPCNPSQALQNWQAAGAPAAAYTLSAGASGTNGINGDDTPAFPYLDRNGQFYYQSAHSLYGATDGRSWDFYSGSNFDTATKASISNSGTNKDTTAFCNNSPTGVNATDAPSGSGYAERNYCDLVGVWVDPDSGTWYGLVHNEFTPQPFGDGTHYDAIDYASSTDQGASWTIQGHAVTTPYSTVRNDTATFPNQTYYYGDGDPRLFVDQRSGYFYVFYMSRLVDKTGGWGAFQEHVARAPIAQKMSSASWSKWYDGAWSQPGVGGSESDVIPADGVGSGWIPPAQGYSPGTSGSIATQVAAGTTPVSSQLSVLNIAWDAYLGKYLGTPENEAGSNQPQHFYVTDDLATEKWTDIGSAGPAQSSWYRWFLDPTSLTGGAIVGRTFRSYCEYSCTPNDSEYTQFTVAPSSSAGLPASPVTSGVGYEIGAGGGAYLTQSGTAVTTTTAPSGTAAQWTFTPTGDGFYTVANTGSAQALGVDSTKNAGRAWEAPVTLGKLASSGPTAGQQWSIQTIMQSPASSGSSTPTGGYRLVNRYSDLALSLTGGTTAVATAPQRAWNNTGTAGDTRPVSAQTLGFTAAGGSADLSGSHTLTLGGEALDDPNWSTAQGTQLDTWSTNGGANQSWTLTKQADGSYTVVNAYSKLCMDDYGGNTAAGTAVIQWACTGNPNQEWTVAALASGAYTLTNVHTGLLLTTAGAADGALVTQQANTGSSLQQWTLG
ncbi:RICIN domain-containing protein [Streptacidiphilus jiangxiensis]|uniref:Ricin-type beta-trefoil lectin domain-like n=1 Tax=Streptacidiphilus jiangxiensis TaxID=235985 RepID=A0A1H7V7F7_STRJI|nr:RICIN domain-containing protein [Streptacidiphilus jiangxiensis]SEM05202.1 Ricin-type beta-trefoil lectin domain-like [Streptacidiphilus jiangxiensis]